MILSYLIDFFVSFFSFCSQMIKRKTGVNPLLSYNPVRAFSGCAEEIASYRANDGVAVFAADVVTAVVRCCIPYRPPLLHEV